MAKQKVIIHSGKDGTTIATPKTGLKKATRDAVYGVANGVKKAKQSISDNVAERKAMKREILANKKK